MDATTIKIHENTKRQLDEMRECISESYDEVIKKVIFIAKTCQQEPGLSQEAVQAIERSRERMKKGRFVTEAEARKRLGL